MRTIEKLSVNDSDYSLVVQFDDSSIKKYDCKPLLALSTFRPLHDKNSLSSVQNKGYYIEWPFYELDISADTLWHDGEPQ